MTQDAGKAGQCLSEDDCVLRPPLPEDGDLALEVLQPVLHPTLRRLPVEWTRFLTLANGLLGTLAVLPLDHAHPIVRLAVGDAEPFKRRHPVAMLDARALAQVDQRLPEPQSRLEPLLRLLQGAEGIDRLPLQCLQI